MMDGVKYIFIDNEYYFKRDSLYGYYDDVEWFVFFSRVVFEVILFLENEFDIIYCYDWYMVMILFLFCVNYDMYDYI